MNDTQWTTLIQVIEGLEFPPPYQRKDILKSDPEPSSFESDVSYFGDWHEGMRPFFSIEWIRIRPRYLKHRGMLLSPSVLDCQRTLEASLQAIGQAYELSADSIWIFGYR